MRLWKSGEKCRVKLGERAANGEVTLASKNGESLFVHFEALLGGHVGSAPLYWQPELGEFVSIATGEVFELSDREPGSAS